MSLAYGYLAQSMRSHDELQAARVNAHRLAAADRLAFEAEGVADAGFAGRSQANRSIAGGRLHRFAERMHLVGARRAQHGHGARAAH